VFGVEITATGTQAEHGARRVAAHVGLCWEKEHRQPVNRSSSLRANTAKNCKDRFWPQCPLLLHLSLSLSLQPLANVGGRRRILRTRDG